jgi:prepilin-type processing-associated H-X9-DG protein
LGQLNVRELLEARVRESDAKLQEAEIKLRQAERRAKTAQTKFDQGLVTAEEVEDQKDAVELAKAELVRLKAEGDTLRLLLQRASRTGEASAAAARSACLVNLKALALAVMLWATDHNETLPPADKWCDELQPYMAEAKASLLCPGDAPKLAELVCGYSYSLAIASKRLADIVDPAGTVMFYESTLNKLNAADNGESEPKPGRHDGGNNRAYVDCHAQWVARE